MDQNEYNEKINKMLKEKNIQNVKKRIQLLNLKTK